MKTSRFEPMPTELQTLKDWVRWSVSQLNAHEVFFGHGTDNSWDEAFYLILAALHLPPDSKELILDARLTFKEQQHLWELLRRRIEERVPAAYLVQESWFAGLSFYVDERVIIPRSPIAELIEAKFSPWIDPLQADRILDVCTGSGCIAVATALNMPGVLVDAIDLSQGALEVAARNVDHYDLDEVVQLLHSDLLQSLPEGTLYDVVVANPPYVSAHEYEHLPDEYHHEPQMALETSDEGLSLVIRLMQEALPHLKPEGVLIVEVGSAQDALVDRFPEIPFTWLTFERGGEGVFLLTHQELKEAQACLR